VYRFLWIVKLKSLGGAVYMLLFIDEYSRFVTANFLGRKDGFLVFDSLKKLIEKFDAEVREGVRR
jgi:hypothetical protein